MVRLSDILGNTPKPKEEPKAVPRASQPPPAAAPPARQAPSSSAAPPQPDNVVSRKLSTALSPMVEALYVQLSLCLHQLFDQARAGKSCDLTEADQLTQQMPRLSAGQYDDILILDEGRPNDHYLISHCVHVAFLTHHLASRLGYTDATAHQLALAGLLLDIGMAGKMEALAEEPRSLTKEERRLVEQHPVNAVSLLRQSQQLSQEALGAIAAHHLRADGSGYPKEAASPVSTEYAKILAVADVYDALTHARSYRKPMNPAHAMKLLIDGVGDQFDRRVVKVLVDELTLYPRGSAIKLSTNELGIVQRVNPGSPLRPLVLIHRDADRHPLIPPREVNLAEHPLITIKEVLVAEDA